MLRRGRFRRWLTAMALVMLPALCLSDEGVDDVAGTLGAVGSDTLASLMLRWGERLAEQYPGVRLQLLASGSASAPAALAAGTTRLGPMSRPMRPDERQAFIDRHGYPPLEIEVARDALVVVVHRHHPLEAVSAEQLDAIFSSTRECGAETPIERWSQLGLSLPADRIVLHGRNMASGTHGLFKQVALCGGDFRVRVNEHMGSAAVVAAVAAEPSSIGYTGMNHLTASVKAVALRDDHGKRHIPTQASVRRGEYPMARGLYLYVNQPPGQRLPAPERAFIELILSSEGQQIVRELGFVPLSDRLLERQRRSLFEGFRDIVDDPGEG